MPVPGSESVGKGEDKGFKRRRVRFTVDAEPGSAVFVAGSFNAWSAQKNRLKEKDGVYSTSILLAPGEYEYKFVIDDVWCVDPRCPEWKPNGMGSLNSVIIVS